MGASRLRLTAHLCDFRMRQGVTPTTPFGVLQHEHNSHDPDHGRSQSDDENQNRMKPREVRRLKQSRSAGLNSNSMILLQRFHAVTALF